MAGKYPQMNPLRDVESQKQELADNIDTLRDGQRSTYNGDTGKPIYKEKRVIRRVLFDIKTPEAGWANPNVPEYENRREVEIGEALRFADYRNVRMSWTQKGGKNTYTPRIVTASPTRFILEIDSQGSIEVFDYILEFKGR
jgi:hypothetical protein